MPGLIPIREPYTPELMPVVQMTIEGILKNGGRVFEFGSGYSTVWLAGMAEVMSVEHDPEWYDEVKGALKCSGRWAYLQLMDEQKLPGAIECQGLFDLVFVDCIDRQRVAAVEHSMPHVMPGGWLVLDDTRWRMLAAAKDMLDAWPHAIIKGRHVRHNGLIRDHQTTFYRRPTNV